MNITNITLFILFICLSASVNAECVGIAKEKYCLGKSPPNKTASIMDDGIYIRRDSERNYNAEAYTYAYEVDKAIGLELSTSATVKNNKIIGISQVYLIDQEARKKADKLYASLLKRLISRHGQPTTKVESKTYSNAEWKAKILYIEIQALFGEISISYELEENPSIKSNRGDKWLR